MTIITIKLKNGIEFRYRGNIQIYHFVTSYGHEVIAVDGLLKDFLLDNSWSQAYEKFDLEQIESINGSDSVKYTYLRPQ